MAATKAPPWWSFHIFTVVGVVLLVAGALALYREQQFTAIAQPARGEVIGYTQHKDLDDDMWMYAPIVRFKTADSTSCEFTSKLKTSSRPYKVGDEVEVLYDPADPKQAELASAGVRYFLPAILLGVGSITFLLGLGGHFYLRPRLTPVS